MKFIGALLIVFGSGSIGFLVAQQMVLRPKQLQQLKTALEMLKTEIDYGVTPLPQAFAKIAQNSTSPIAEIFAGAKENLDEGAVAQTAWQSAVDEIISQTALGEEGRKLLMDISYNLGNSSRADQIRHLNLAQEQINNIYQEAITEKEQKVKLWRYLGVLTGLLLVIIIV